MKRVLSSIVLCASLLAGKAVAAPFTIEIVADNDFAVFTGTDSSINHLLYQNNEVWNNQIAQLSSLTFNVSPGDDKFYILAMGGGTSEENISGLINGVNMTNSSVAVQMSTDVSSFLTGYSSSAYSTGGPVVYADVEDGTYNALLADVQTAFLSLTASDWSTPTVNTTQSVITSSGFGAGYAFDELSARLFVFDVEDVDVDVPEPPLTAVLALFSVFALLRVRSKKS